MHIAQFVHRYPPAPGGAEAYAARLTEFLHAQGDTVDIWTTTAFDLEDFWRHSSQQFPESDKPLRRYRPLTFPLRRYVLKALTFVPSARLRSFVLPCNPICLKMWRDAGRYDGPLDAVHASAFPYAWLILCARRLARRRGVPFVMTPFLHLGDQRTRNQYLQPALRWLLLDADAILVQTRTERDEVLKLGVAEDRVILQGLGVTAEECTGGDRTRFRRRYGIADHEVVIGHLANLSVEKGSVDLLRAGQRLKCRLVLAGPSMQNFRDKLQGIGVRPILPGLVTDSEKRDFFAGIDVFALPSRCDSFGLVLLEAWANQKPVVVYDAGGPGELVRHGIDGLSGPMGDINHLTRNLSRLIHDVTLRNALGRTGQARCPVEFDWGSKLNIVRNTLLDQIIARGRSDVPRVASTRSHHAGCEDLFPGVRTAARTPPHTARSAA